MSQHPPPKVYVANRFWVADSTRASAQLAMLERFIVEMSALSVAHIGIAVHTEADKSDALAYVGGLGLAEVTAFAVTPWGRFVPALNVLLEDACAKGCDRILFASTDVRIEQYMLDAMLKHVDARHVVAGLALEGHLFSEGEHACDGLRSPWNTVALWRIPNGLDRMGFPAVGEALHSTDSVVAGMEEVGAIAVLQKLYPDDCNATLLDVGPVEWEHGARGEPERHRVKMVSKQWRAERQLFSAGLSTGGVVHKKAPR